MAARFLELSRRAYENNYVTRTDFLTLNEQAMLEDMRMGRLSGTTERLSPAKVVLYGGFSDAERKAAFFLPDYMEEEDVPKDEIACLKISPLQRQFADELTHRDYLGALMNLGIERDLIGDILLDRTQAEAWIFVVAERANIIENELTRVKHTSVSVKLENAENCHVRPEFDERSGSVASERTDAVLAFVYRLSRGKAQELISREAVSVDGRIISSAGQTLKDGSRVSVKGFGKFIFDGIEKETKKGRLFVRVRIFK